MKVYIYTRKLILILTIIEDIFKMEFRVLRAHRIYVTSNYVMLHSFRIVKFYAVQKFTLLVMYALFLLNMISFFSHWNILVLFHKKALNSELMNVFTSVNLLKYAFSFIKLKN